MNKEKEKKTLSDKFIMGSDVFDDEFYYMHDDLKDSLKRLTQSLIGPESNEPDAIEIKNKVEEEFGKKLI